VCDVSTLINRDVSPGNIVACNGEGFLLDYHVACKEADCEQPDAHVTGKAWYRALSLNTGHHTVSTDLESLFYSVIDMASDGKALRWRHACSEQQLFEKKFTSMMDGSTWEGKVLSRITGEMQAHIQRLHDLFFRPIVTTGMYEYCGSSVTPSAFIEACLG
jgi:Fungal protein kinase